MTTIQIRIDERTKRSTKKIFKKYGLDLTSGIKLYLSQVDIRKRIPHELLTVNGMTEAQEDEILRISKEAEAGKNLIGPFKGKEAAEYLRSLM